ncbi:hypothetical protein [Halogranum amylolyticum]|nr:hypothetical protein [Halogranum amylolyticum]
MDILHTTSPTAAATTGNRRIDVTEMDAATLAEYVDDELADATVRLERRANRTYLVADGVN